MSARTEVASPTCEGTYTGPLKLVLDRFPGGTGLRGLFVIDGSHDDPAACADWPAATKPLVSTILANRGEPA
ncbi:hypothetical protein ACFO1B_16780 [Dactylosporangium siamense]|uniref:Uncharacterized protein n=1 Tax=Dactylosporangium siamense TaxID=685454 RepID=A0A919PL09_9ACTN|nr:hypothetical protein [Dactylosporangium siamense]GIG45497.1 hypothetical protein Dsi01nite_035380 [Dactylosporangium siamense]